MRQENNYFSHRVLPEISSKRHLMASVWTSLVIDQQARHYKKMKNSIWLFLYILLHADSASGVVSKKIGIICSDMGLKRDTVRRWLNILKKQGYIATRNTGRDLLIQIRVWNSPFSNVAENTHQKQDISDCSNRINPKPELTSKKPHSFNIEKKPTDPIDISINNNILKIDIDILICRPDASLCSA